MFDITSYDIIEDDANDVFQVRTKANVFLIQFDDPDKRALFRQFCEEVTANRSSYTKIYQQLVDQYGKNKVLDVLSELKEYQLLPPEVSKLAFQTSGMGEEAKNYLARFEQPLLFVGGELLGEPFVDKARREGYKNVTFLNFRRSDFEAVEAAMAKAAFTVVDGYEFDPGLLKLINKLAIKLDKPWLLVGGVEGTEINIGPLFYAKETGCYDCLRRRRMSQDEALGYNRVFERHLLAQKKAGKPDQFIDNGILIDLTVNYALLEVGKYLTEWSVPESWKAMLLIDLFSYQLRKHHLLKVPYCETCKPTLKHNLAPWLEAVTLK
ncbi:MAG: TOMM precursor leader peptide-binding protein [Bacteroidota bacterium]